MNSPTLRWMLIALGIATPLLVAGYIHSQRDPFSCEAHATIVDDQSVIDIMMNYSFNDGLGTYQMTGEYSQDGGAPIAISNKIDFNYWHEGGKVIMVSNETNELPKKNQAYRINIPDFYQARNRGIRIKITPVNSSGYLFIFANSPTFYCSKR